MYDPTAFAYIAWWPSDFILKSGFASSHRRWRTFEIRGVAVAGKTRFPHHTPAFECEDEYHAMICSLPGAERAFSSAVEAVPYLGHSGGGYLECVRVPSIIDAPSMLGALLTSHARTLSTNERDERDALTLEALPLAMEMAHSVTRATNRINDDGSTEARP